VTALSLCVPAAIGLFLLVMERFEAALFPAAPDRAAQGDDGQPVDRAPEAAALADLRITEPASGTPTVPLRPLLGGPADPSLTVDAVS
jgi:hypothetical protein